MTTCCPSSLLHPGLVVATPSGAVQLRGRNGCYPWMWWGHPVRDGEADTRRVKLVDTRGNVAAKTQDGARYVLPVEG